MKLDKDYKILSLKILKDFFIVALVTFTLFFIFDLIKPGFVTSYLNMNIFLLLVIASGIMTVVLEPRE